MAFLLSRPSCPQREENFKHGVLTVRLPMREEAKPRSIKVDVAA
jgi:HSP20 family molecular chaperone IbpA